MPINYTLHQSTATQVSDLVEGGKVVAMATNGSQIPHCVLQTFEKTFGGFAGIFIVFYYVENV